MAFQCLTLGDSLEQNGLGELEVKLATDSGLEILASGLNIVDEQRASQVQSYTPTFRIGGYTSANDMSNLGNGTLRGWYQQVGDTVHFSAYIRIGSTTVFGYTGVFYWGLPTTAHSLTNLNVGTSFVYDISGTAAGSSFLRFPVSSFGGSYPTFAAYDQVIAVSSGDTGMATTSGVPTLGSNGDWMYIQGMYRTA